MIAICLLCFLNSESIQKQPYLQHQWEYRVLVVVTNNRNHSLVEQQLNVLQSHPKGLEERKLLLCQVYPEGITKGFNQSSIEIPNKEWYPIYASDKPLEVLLFGLDGSKKLYSNTLVSLDKLIAIIDAMPMRQTELNQND